MRMTAVVTRLGKMALRDLASAPGRAKGSIVDVLNDAAEQVFSVSQRYVPVRTGVLKGSGRMWPADKRDLTASVIYSADYAAAVHELHPSKSHYLTRAADLVIDNMPKEVAASIVATYR